MSTVVGSYVVSYLTYSSLLFGTAVIKETLLSGQHRKRKSITIASRNLPKLQTANLFVLLYPKGCYQGPICYRFVLR